MLDVASMVATGSLIATGFVVMLYSRIPKKQTEE